MRPGARALCTRSNLEGEDPLDRFHPEREYDTGAPTVAVNDYGKGRAIYIAGDVGGAYMNNPCSRLKRFVVNLVQRTPPPIQIEAPEALEITAARRPFMPSRNWCPCGISGCVSVASK